MSAVSDPAIVVGVAFGAWAVTALARHSWARVRLAAHGMRHWWGTPASRRALIIGAPHRRGKSHTRF